MSEQTSSNQSAATRFLALCHQRGVRKVVIVGGSPGVWEDVRRRLGKALEVKFVLGTKPRSADAARSDIAWADLVLIWGGSELKHMVSALYVRGGPHVGGTQRRGVAALFSDACEFLERRRAAV